MKIGLDIDGIFADFDTRFIETILRVTDRDLFPSRPFVTPVWDYPQHYGYTQEEIIRVWDTIKLEAGFWATLSPFPHTRHACEALYARHANDDIYFVTARPGYHAKAQTEKWLRSYVPASASITVLMSADKAAVARALSLDVYLDDRFKNALSVATSSSTRSFLFTRSQNVGITHPLVTRVDTMADFLCQIAHTPV